MEPTINAAPLVIKLSGKALGAEPELECLFRALRRAGRVFLLVHGGGVAVDRLMTDLGLEVKRVRGLRVSPAEEMPLIAGALAGTCSLQLRGAAVRAGLSPLGLAATDGGMCRVVPEDPELGRVAKTQAGGDEERRRLLVRPAAHVCLCGESPLTAREGEGLTTRQSQGGNKLMKEADSK